MAEFELNEPDVIRPMRRTPEQRGIIGFLIQKGIAKNVTTANLILIGTIIVLCIISAIAIFGGSGEVSSELTPMELDDTLR